MIILLLIIVCILAYTVEIIFGMAGTILMVMVMSFFMEIKDLVIFSVMPQIAVALIALWRSPNTVEIKFLMGMLVYAISGAFAGIYLFYAFPTRIFQMALAAMITLSGVYLVFGRGKIRLGNYGARVLDTTAGVSQALFGISGPLAMTRLLGTFENKTLIRNYALSFFLSLNLFRLAGYSMNGTITQEIGRIMLIVAPFLVVWLWFSNHLHFRINESLFRVIVSWLILLGGISLFLH